MSYFRLMLMLMSMLTLVLPHLGTQIHAMEPENSMTTVMIGKTVKFEDAQGKEVLVAPGIYAVVPGKETLHLTDTQSNTSVTIAADENSHNTEISTLTAISIPGEDGPLANTHVVILLLPDGQTLQAIGTYPGIQHRGIPSESEIAGNPTTITFKKAVHFIAPDGSPVVVAPGTYTAEVAQGWIRLIPGKARQNAILVEAQKGTHDTEVEELVALSLPGSTDKDRDLHHVLLLLPTGHTLEATGSHSGIQPRGWSMRTFANAKRRVARTYKHARGASTIAKDRSRAALIKAKRAAELRARVANLSTGWVKQGPTNFLTRDHRKTGGTSPPDTVIDNGSSAQTGSDPRGNVPSHCTPSPREVAFFDQNNYQGRCSVRGVGDYPKSKHYGLPNNSLSSLLIGAEVQVWFCEDYSFKGNCLQRRKDIRAIFGQNIEKSSISSVKVQPKGTIGDGCIPGPREVTIFRDSKYRGECKVLAIGSYSQSRAFGLPNDSISSIRVGNNATAVLFADNHYKGGSKKVLSDISDLGHGRCYGPNTCLFRASVRGDTTSSIKVRTR